MKANDDDLRRPCRLRLYKTQWDTSKIFSDICQVPVSDPTQAFNSEKNILYAWFHKTLNQIALERDLSEKNKISSY